MYTTWTLNLYYGSCSLSASKTYTLVLPAAVAGLNLKTGYYPLLYASSPGLTQGSYNYFWNNYAVIYATADPRNSDDSASNLIGGTQPSFMNIGFTATLNVTSGAVIQLVTSPAAFRRPSSVIAVDISGTGCTATLASASTGNGTTTTLKFTLSGASCRISQNVAVEGSQFQLPANMLSINPVDTTVSITVTIIVGSTTYAAKNANPGTYTTTNGCSGWSSWSSCSTTCGAGYTYRTRTGNPSNCLTTITTRSCNHTACDCAPWSEWGSCSATCGGTISRYRTGSASSCDAATVDTQTCGPTSCVCPWTQTACSSSCGSGVRTRTITPESPSTNCGTQLQYDVVCNETFTTESLACSCVDVPWTDLYGNTCADYASKNWCTSSGEYGAGWDFSQPLFSSFDARANNQRNALSACCACGKDRCVKDTVLLIDQSSSIILGDWYKIKQYITDRVNQTTFTDDTGNRIAVVQFDVAASVLCPLTWDRAFLLDCVAAITFPAGASTATAAGLKLTNTVFERYSSPNRTRVVELLTDGSPNVPAKTAVADAYTAAYVLKDSGVTVITIGTGIECVTSTQTNCLNRVVLNTLASEPASSYAVLLDTYDSLTAVALFISSQCTTQLTAYIASMSPSPSPLPSPSPSFSPLPSPSPDGSAICKLQEDLIPSDWLWQLVQGCSRDTVANLLQQYECVELQPFCGTFQCSRHIPSGVFVEMLATCNTITV
eukprot:GGOE01011525.1.p1 GENE.GGOE01011525.1~~GGOE01011525.1.p1  ORF type:complete len:832 (-),score=94.81 GGOE01011525.1:683-2842(-)